MHILDAQDNQTRTPQRHIQEDAPGKSIIYWKGCDSFVKFCNISIFGIILKIIDLLLVVKFYSGSMLMPILETEA